jgi:hypothetical protein
MRKNTVLLTTGIAAAVVLSLVAMSCGSSTDVNSKVYVATLLPANEVPPKTSAGSGVATFDDVGTEIDWTLELTNMTGVTLSHIHLGPAGVAPPGNIIENLFIPLSATPTVNGVVMQGSITNANNPAVSLDSLRVLFNNGGAYVNVHTSVNPGGEIRGQIALR